MDDIFNFVWDQGAHMFLRRNKQNFYIILAVITYSKSTIEVLEQCMKYVQKSVRKNLEQYHRRRSKALIVNSKHVLHLVCSIVLIVNFEQAMSTGLVKIFFIVIKKNYYNG